MKYPDSLEKLIESFEKYPGIGHKTAQRLAFHTLLHFSKEDIELFQLSLIESKNKIKRCEICGNLTEGDICDICKDETRDKETIMVLEDVKDLMVLEQLNQYNGLYHVLNGVISFKYGINADDLNINSLLKRLDNIKEIIIATNATVEGETTAKYLKIILKEYKGKITRLAYGLPVGSDLGYADEMTILKAIEGRRNYE